MANIVSSFFVDRSTIAHKMDDGTFQVECRSESNHVAYYDDSNVLQPIDVVNTALSTSPSIGSFSLRRKNRASVGIRSDSSPYKYLGIRPDDCQNGSEQLEFSVESIKINGISISDTVSTLTPLTNIVDKYSDYVHVMSYRNGCRQLIRIRKKEKVKSFEIVYCVHVHGLDLVRMGDLDEFWFYSQGTGNFRFRIRHPLLVDKDTYKLLAVSGVEDSTTLISHTLSEIQADGTYLYTKRSTVDYSTLSLPEEYFIDASVVYSSTADGYVFRNSTSFSTSRSSTTGSAVGGDTTTAAYALACDGSYNINRSFFYFALTSLSGVIINAAFSLYGYTNTASSVMCQLGTQAASLTTADFDSMTSLDSGIWGSCTLSTSGYVGMILNAAGIAVVQSTLGSTLKICAREYNHDYLNVTTGGTNYRNGIYFSDTTGTTYDPKLTLILRSVKTFNGLGIASVNTINGIDQRSLTNNVKTIIGIS